MPDMVRVAQPGRTAAASVRTCAIRGLEGTSLCLGGVALGISDGQWLPRDLLNVNTCKSHPARDDIGHRHGRIPSN